MHSHLMGTLLAAWRTGNFFIKRNKNYKQLPIIAKAERKFVTVSTVCIEALTIKKFNETFAG